MRDWIPDISAEPPIPGWRIRDAPATRASRAGTERGALGREPEVVFETSLATLATDPERKRKLWHLIKPLKA